MTSTNNILSNFAFIRRIELNCMKGKFCNIGTLINNISQHKHKLNPFKIIRQGNPSLKYACLDLAINFYLAQAILV